MTAQRFEKWLEGAGDQAAHDRTIDIDLADARSPLDLPERGRAHETDFDTLDRMLRDHVLEPREHAARCHPGNP